MEREVLCESLVEIVRNVWESVLAVALYPSETVEQIPHGITACVQISGAWAGVVCAQFSPSLAKSSAAAMLGADADELSNDDLRDALGELANMIGGNLKSLMAGPSTLTLPWVTTGDGYLVDFPHCEMTAEITMLGDDGMLGVRVLTALPHEAVVVAVASRR